MKALFEFIALAITTRIRTTNKKGDDVPFFTVEMWRGQSTRERLDKTQNPYRTPTVFIEFITEEVRNLSLGIKNVQLIVRFRFALQSMKMERLDDLDILDGFDAQLQGLRGDPHDTLPCFSSLQKQAFTGDPDHDNVNEPILEYSTIYREKVAYKQGTYITHAPIKPAVTGQTLQP